MLKLHAVKCLVGIVLVVFFTVTGLTGPAIAQAADVGGLRYTVTVAKFENKAGWAGQWDLGDAWGVIMTDILNQTGKFIVLGETDMRKEAMEEQDLGASGRTAKGAITPQSGYLTPAQLIVKGAITHVQEHRSDNAGGIAIGGVFVGGKKSSAEVNVTMYMIDSTTGQVLASKSVVGKSNSSGSVIGYSGHGWGGGLANFKKDNMGKAVEAAVKLGVQWMTEQLPKIAWRGSVIMVRDGDVYINRGIREGVQVGQQFVAGYSEVIRDPDTGEVLDESLETVAVLQVKTVKEKLAICEVIEGDYSSIEKGLTVKLP